MLYKRYNFKRKKQGTEQCIRYATISVKKGDYIVACAKNISRKIH